MGMMKVPFMVVMVMAFSVHGQTNTETTCEFDGQIFQAGEVLGDLFQTRCGSTEDYPCYCDPAIAAGGVNCPYCGLATESGGLECARVDETVIVTNIQGVTQECYCYLNAGTGMPESICQDAAETTPTPTNPSAGGGIEEDDVCILEYSDGTTVVFEDGESYGLLIDSPCGPNRYPCYCNVNLPGKIDCPYCTYTNSFGITVCGVVGETTNFMDQQGEDQSCTCLDDYTSTCDDEEDTPSPVTTPAPQASPTLPPNPLPTTPAPTTATPTTPTNTCVKTNPDGSTVIFQDGESYGDYIESPCDDTQEYPCYCAPDMLQSNQVNCPYCTYTNRFDSIVCGEIGETTVFQNLADETQICTCFDDLSTSCDVPTPVPAPTQPTKIPTLAPISVPTEDPMTPSPVQFPTFDKPTILLPNRPPITPTLPPGCVYLNQETGELDVVPNGESFDATNTGVTGPCQPSEEFPVICNTEESFTQREYPYCVFETSSSSTTTSRTTPDVTNNIICAYPDTQIQVAQSDGTIQDCACIYLNPAIGPVSNCPLMTIDLSDPQQPTSSPIQDNSPPISPTMSPVSQPPTILRGGSESGDDSNEESSSTTSTITMLLHTLLVLPTILLLR